MLILRKMIPRRPIRRSKVRMARATKPSTTCSMRSNRPSQRRKPIPTRMRWSRKRAGAPMPQSARWPMNAAPRSIQTPLRPASDSDFDREEAELAAYRAKPDATQEGLQWLQWKIDSNRKMRSSERNSQGALAEARDLADRSAFDRLEITKPKIFKAYAKRVEDTIADLRSKGQAAPPRLALLRFLVGDDLMNGKIKPKQAKAAAGGEPAAAAQVPRGRTPGTRSDVSGRQKQNEREARRERLRNTNI